MFWLLHYLRLLLARCITLRSLFALGLFKGNVFVLWSINAVLFEKTRLKRFSCRLTDHLLIHRLWKGLLHGISVDRFRDSLFYSLFLLIAATIYWYLSYFARAEVCLILTSDNGAHFFFVNIYEDRISENLRVRHCF